MTNQICGVAGLERCATCNRLRFGEETVTITITEYEALKTASISSLTRMKIASYRAVSGSKIARKPDLAEFIIANAATMTVEQIRLACAQRFGSAAPSWSSIYRFLEAVKHGGAGQRHRS